MNNERKPTLILSSHFLRLHSTPNVSLSLSQLPQLRRNSAMARRRRPDRRSASTGVSLLSFLSFLPHFSLSRSAAAQLRLGLHPATIWSHQPPPATAAAAYTAVSPPSTERGKVLTSLFI